MEDECRRIVQRLKTLKLNFLALDFDMTVIDIHTGGRWSGSACELSEQIRPFFRALIPAAIAEGACDRARRAPPSPHLSYARRRAASGHRHVLAPGRHDRRRARPQRRRQ